MAIHSEVGVNIRGLAVGGAGVGEVVGQSNGRSDLLGITAFVPFTVPGELVWARTVQEKDRHVEAQLLEVQKSADCRRIPRCRHFMTCGGCELQHISYEGQLEAKYQLLKGAMKAARLGTEVVELLNPVCPSSEYAYRRRVTLHLNANGQVGFYRPNSRSVVAIEECPVLVPELQELLPSCASFARTVSRSVTSMTLESDMKGVIVVLRSAYDLGDSEVKQVLKEARKFFANVTLITGEREVGGFGRQILELPLNERKTLVLQVTAGFFSQVNWPINLAVVARLLRHCGSVVGKRVYDLYSGAGNFAFPLLRAGANVVAVESDRRLVTSGRQTAVANGFQQKIEFNNVSVENFLNAAGIKADTHAIIVDPPRAGLGSAVKSLANARHLMLISCHVPSFIRDLKALVQHGWIPKAIEPFDMFPQTSYVEVLSVYESSSP
ncbi:MAG: class I SAM-dependent RNA methyltransferase [Deltaproteobacteria bacterium]|nr:class I SAM-dependent RNA methyltransferase [Deltaproteobacteria bacterium]